jgi:zinc protease
MKPRLLRALASLAAAALLAACGPKPAPSSQQQVRPDPTGQVQPAEPPLALWPAVTRGVLPNGMTYYVLKHGKPEQRAFLWLAVNAGSVQEDDDQRGLAHFVEHMAFNGTKRFPKQDLVNYLESIGMKFGPDLNAYTSFDETVYQLQVPTDDPQMIAKGFDILHDWAADITFDPVEVDKERGVVLEEWRLGRGAQQRLLDKLIKVVFGDARYASRLPIGLPEILQKAPRDALVRYYKDWYRPDLMAVFAVGDFTDPAEIEKQIVAKFGDLAKPASPRPRPPGGMPTTKTTRVAVETDAELPVSVVGVGNLIAHRPEASASDFRRIVAEQLYQQMLNERLQTIARRPDAPFATAAVLMQNITREADAFARFAVVKNDDVEGALKSLFAEVLRIERYGFAQSELDRARTVLLRNYEQNATAAETSSSRDLVAELVRHFLEGEFVIGREAERDLAVATLPRITLDELTSLARSFGGAESRVIVVAGPDGKPMPTSARVLAIVDDVAKAKLDAWVDQPITAQLMEPPAWPGTVEKESTIDALGVTEWKLSNGVRVLVKATDYERDAVTIAGSSPGGLAMAPARDLVHARFAAEIAEAGGVGELDADALGKALAGKQVSVNVDIGDTLEWIEGSGSARDVETMLQLIHLRMTAPRRDEQAFGVWKTNTLEMLTNQARSPEAEFFRRSQEVLWQKHPHRRPAEPADVKATDLDKALAFYRERFADASDFTFVIVGAIDTAKLRPMVEAYLGSLPGAGKKEREKDAGARRVGGVTKKTWNLGKDSDKAMVQLVFHGDEAWTRDKERDMFVLGQVLAIRLREVLREDLGGVYGVGANGSISRTPRQERQFTIRFGCAPGAVDKLVDAAHAEIATIAKSGIDASYLDKVRQAFVRERETAMRTNRFWIDWLSRAVRHGDDPTIILDPQPAIARMTPANVKAAAARFLDRKRLYQAVMLPAAP